MVESLSQCQHIFHRGRTLLQAQVIPFIKDVSKSFVSATVLCSTLTFAFILEPPTCGQSHLEIYRGLPFEKIDDTIPRSMAILRNETGTSVRIAGFEPFAFSREPNYLRYFNMCPWRSFAIWDEKSTQQRMQCALRRGNFLHLCKTKNHKKKKHVEGNTLKHFHNPCREGLNQASDIPSCQKEERIGAFA